MLWVPKQFVRAAMRLVSGSEEQNERNGSECVGHRADPTRVGGRAAGVRIRLAIATRKASLWRLDVAADNV